MADGIKHTKRQWVNDRYRRILNAGETDDNFASVVLLLPFDGTDEDVATTDLSDSSHTISFVSTAKLDNANTKFGSTSLLLNNTATNSVTAPDHADWDFDTGEFTIEWWMKPAVGETAVVMGQYSGVVATRAWDIELQANQLTFRYQAEAPSSSVGTVATTTSPVTADQWYYCVIQRSANTISIWVDGTLEKEASIGAVELRNATGTAMRIGDAEPTWAGPFNGNIENVRITKGVARYTAGAAIDVPTAAWPTS